MFSFEDRQIFHDDYLRKFQSYDSYLLFWTRKLSEPIIELAGIPRAVEITRNSYPEILTEDEFERRKLRVFQHERYCSLKEIPLTETEHSQLSPLMQELASKQTALTTFRSHPLIFVSITNRKHERISAYVDFLDRYNEWADLFHNRKQLRPNKNDLVYINSTRRQTITKQESTNYKLKSNEILHSKCPRLIVQNRRNNKVLVIDAKERSNREHTGNEEYVSPKRTDFGCADGMRGYESVVLYDYEW